MEPLMLRPEDAGKALGLSRSHVYDLIAKGKIETVKVGKARLIPVAELHAFVARCMEERESAKEDGPLVEEQAV